MESMTQIPSTWYVPIPPTSKVIACVNVSSAPAASVSKTSSIGLSRSCDTRRIDIVVSQGTSHAKLPLLQTESFVTEPRYLRIDAVSPQGINLTKLHLLQTESFVTEPRYLNKPH